MKIHKMLLAYVIYMLMGLSLVSATTNTDEYKWIQGKLDAVYSSNYNSTTAQGSVEYFISVSKIKMVKLDMSNFPTTNNKWQGLLRKNVEIKVTTLNHIDVLARKAKSYVVLDIKPKQVSQIYSAKAKALVVDDAKKPWLNLLCKFADIATEPHTSSFYQTMFGNTYPYLEHYWKETTYGLIDISGTQTMDWVTLPHNRSYYVHGDYNGSGVSNTDLHLLREDCIDASGVASMLDTYYGTNLFFNGALDGPAWGGGGTTWLPTWAEDNLGVIAHEMGHGYGLPHSSGRYGNDYDSPWDVMSGGRDGQQHGVYYNAPSHTIAFYKQKLGVININAQWSNAQVDASGGELIHLSRLEESAVAGDYLIANIYSTDGTKHYTVEARDKIGYDSSLPAKAVIIHEIEDNYRAYVVDPDNNGNLSDAGTQWQVGETFTDSANNISVEIVSSTATGYNIRITVARTKPAKATGITATTNLLEKVRVIWSPSQGAEYYKVLRYDGWDINGTHQTYTTANNNTYYDDVPDGANYHVYRVKACNSAGCSVLGTYDYDGGSRPRVQNVTVSSDQINNIHLTWDTLNGATSYRVIRYDDYELTINRQEFSTNSTSYNNVTQGRYYYVVQGCNANGCSIVSYSRSGRDAYVSNIKASSDLFDKVHVTWDAVNGATYYQVLRYEGFALDSAFVEFNTGNSAAFYDDVPADFRGFYYRVKACNSTGCSPVPYASYGHRNFSITASDGTYTDKVTITYPVLPSSVKSFYLWRRVEGESSYSYVTGATDVSELIILLDTTAERNVKYDYLMSLYDASGNNIGQGNDVGYRAWDTDNDGVVDSEDAFPSNANESVDTDHDGIGNNADKDDDNDGISDTLELANGLNPLNASDAQVDLDHDGFSNAIEISLGTDMRNAKSKPTWAPVIMGDIMIFIPSK